MYRVSLSLCFNKFKAIILFCGVVTLLLLTASTSAAQRSKGSVDTPDESHGGFQFRGVKIGMVTDEARKILGAAREKTPEQDF